ncbi:hypothetical protein LCL97_14085 [Seohaeicola saemankumensis]|nr:hypothetical protein [Seohaeicola saemankumensis]MCA0871964.1 hypothetical protein [Seohaeicola saemankumensis]
MHFDALHAAVAAILIFATIWGMKRFGLAKRDTGGWDWALFAGVFVVIFLFNLIWPVD